MAADTITKKQSSRKKVVLLFGTRPEAIKMAPLVNELARQPEDFEVKIVLTSQHREMLDQVLELFELRSDYDLDVMEPLQSLFDISVKALNGLEEILRQEQPDILLVQGDTTSALMGALAAFYLKIPVGHVEAGLRTHDRYRPFPEEMNRRLITQLAWYHFAPTESARQNLLAEGIDERNVYVTGNTVIDALMSMVKRDYRITHPVLKEVDFDRKRIVLVTAHRRENWGRPLKEICRAVGRLLEDYPDVCVIFSVHKNPAVKKTIEKLLGQRSRIYLLDSLDYELFAHVMAASYLILTDSGGVQEEAPSLGVPVLVLRDTTERPEGLEAGTVRLAGTEEEKIYAEAAALLTHPDRYQKMARTVNPYGDGHAARMIVGIIKQQLSSGGLD